MKENILQSFGMRVLLALFVLMLMILMASYATLNYERVKYLDPSPTVISVQGQGEVLAVPDVGEFSFAVEAEAKEAGQAIKMSGTKINDIISYLKQVGVEEKDIKTLNYNLYPKYRWEDRACSVGSYCPPGKRVRDGYKVSQTVRVKVRNTEKAGEIIAGVGKRGATNISSLSFTVDDTEKLKAEAREKAIKDAQEKAAILAKQLGVKIVRLAGFREEGNYYEPPFRAAKLSVAEDGEAVTPPELPVGEQSTRVNVTIDYEVR